MSNKTYRILNYGHSPVSVSTRDHNYRFEGGTVDEPFGLVFTDDELAEINYSGCAFKAGYIFPEDNMAEYVYTEILHISNWKDILHNREIEDILVHPTADGIRKLLSINTAIGFERVIGTYIMLKNEFADIPTQIKILIDERKDELTNGIMMTRIKISDLPKDPRVEIESISQKLAEAEAENAKLLAELEKLRNAKPEKDNNSADVKKAVDAAKKKPATKG